VVEVKSKVEQRTRHWLAVDEESRLVQMPSTGSVLVNRLLAPVLTGTTHRMMRTAGFSASL
jgi:hypothetical protein